MRSSKVYRKLVDNYTCTGRTYCDKWNLDNAESEPKTFINSSHRSAKC